MAGRRRAGFFPQLPYLLGLLAVAGALLAAGSPAGGGVPEGVRPGELLFSDLPGECAFLRSLTVKPNNIFEEDDPFADAFYARAANSLHIVTRESVIRRGLSLREGERVCLEDVQAALRRLRALPFLHTNVLTHGTATGDTLDLTVETRDIWSTRPMFNFRMDGGLIVWTVGLEEVNFLGYGKGISLEGGNDGVQPYWGAWYRDAQLAGSDLDLFAAFARGSDLRSGTLSLRRAVDRVDAAWSINTRLESYRGTIIDRRGGLEGPEWRTDRWLLDLAGGPRIVRGGNRAVRLKPAFYVRSERYETPEDSTSGWVGYAPLKRREIRAVGLEFDFFHERYSVRTGVDAIDRQEDFNLGTDLRLGVGYSPETFGALQNSVFGRVVGSRGFPLGRKQFGSVSVQGEGEIVKGRLHDVRLLSGLRYYNTLTDRHTLGLHARFDWSRRAAPQAAFTLGAESGLRGFEAFSFWGDYVLLVNAEDRMVLTTNLFGLVHVGAVAFVDAGVAWRSGRSTEAEPRVSPGLGLRLLGSRGGGTLVTRIDVGFPMVGREGDFEPIISLGAGQAF